jgi:hypothetical protein
MNKIKSQCPKLIEKTAEALKGEEVLQKLLMSAQGTNLKICTKYAVGGCVSEGFCVSRLTQINSVLRKDMHCCEQWRLANLSAPRSCLQHLGTAESGGRSAELVSRSSGKYGADP